jgi:hypothetical protein
MPHRDRFNTIYDDEITDLDVMIANTYDWRL